MEYELPFSIFHSRKNIKTITSIIHFSFSIDIRKWKMHASLYQFHFSSWVKNGKWKMENWVAPLSQFHFCRLMAVSQWVGIATGLSVVCRLSSVCNVRGLWPDGDRWAYDFFAVWQGKHLATPGIKPHRNRYSRLWAVAVTVGVPSVSRRQR